jgi:uncharacterized protein
MHFATLVAQSELSGEIVDIVEQLLAAKAATRELGTGTLPGPIGSLIDAEFSQARALWPSAPWRPEPALVAEADSFFRNWIRR